jgi:hypothetical protein
MMQTVYWFSICACSAVLTVSDSSGGLQPRITDGDRAHTKTVDNFN